MGNVVDIKLPLSVSQNFFLVSDLGWVKLEVLVNFSNLPQCKIEPLAQKARVLTTALYLLPVVKITD